MIQEEEYTDGAITLTSVLGVLLYATIGFALTWVVDSASGGTKVEGHHYAVVVALFTFLGLVGSYAWQRRYVEARRIANALERSNSLLEKAIERELHELIDRHKGGQA